MPCGHHAPVTHDNGGRIIQCPACPLRAIVQAKRVTRIEYQVQEASPSLLESMSDEDAQRNQEWKDYCTLESPTQQFVEDSAKGLMTDAHQDESI